MAKVRSSVARHKRKKRMLKLAEGYYGRRKSTYKNASESVERGLACAYTGRKNRKRDFRRLWITRISAACALNDINYSTFMGLYIKQGGRLNRKMLSELAIQDQTSFANIIESAKTYTAEPKR